MVSNFPKTAHLNHFRWVEQQRKRMPNRTLADQGKRVKNSIKGTRVSKDDNSGQILFKKITKPTNIAQIKAVILWVLV